MELRIDRVSKQYKNKLAVDRVSMNLHEGVYGLLGENGAGKTSLIRMVCGVLKPTGGSISFDGLDVGDEEYRALLGYLPQDFGYYPEFSAQDFMYYMASLKGLNKAGARARTRELLELVSLNEVAKKKIKTFSGGMKQRLGIAQSLLNDPKLLVLDEPTAGLDPKERVRFRNLIARLGQNRIVLLSTHIVSDVEHIAGTILLMKEGRLLHRGSLEELTRLIQGKVYELVTGAEQAEELARRWRVINYRSEGDKVFLRFVCEGEPPAGAAEVLAGLEDLYLYCFSESERYE